MIYWYTLSQFYVIYSSNGSYFLGIFSYSIFLLLKLCNVKNKTLIHIFLKSTILSLSPWSWLGGLLTFIVKVSEGKIEWWKNELWTWKKIYWSYELCRNNWQRFSTKFWEIFLKHIVLQNYTQVFKWHILHLLTLRWSSLCISYLWVQTISESHLGSFMWNGTVCSWGYLLPQYDLS